MDVLTKEEFEQKKRRYLGMVREGALFIHPTDTVYGMGCDATNERAVKALREAKIQHEQPFSVIAPSKEWIAERCELGAAAEGWLAKLPGQYTLILRLKDRKAVAPSVNLGKATLGVRIPAHWFSAAVGELGVPVVTTSANVHGQEFMTSLADLAPALKAKMAFALYEGEKSGRPSTLVDLSSPAEKITER